MDDHQKEVSLYWKLTDIVPGAEADCTEDLPNSPPGAEADCTEDLPNSLPGAEADCHPAGYSVSLQYSQPLTENLLT